MFIYSRFEELRKEKGITKKFISEQLGRSTSLCQGWKEGKSEPNRDQLLYVAKLLGTTPEYLTGETDKKSPSSITTKSLRICWRESETTRTCVCCFL